jgi:CRISPR-associated protein Csd1
MILSELTDFAIRRGLDDPLVEPIRTHAAVRIDERGCLRSLEQYSDRTVFLLPREALRSSNVLPQVLWDKSSYLLGNPPKGKQDRKLSSKRDACVDIHRRILEHAPDDPRLAAALKFLRRKPYKKLTDLQEGNYVLFFEDDEEPIGALPEIRPCLEAVRLSKLRTVGEGVCPISGRREMLVADNHPKIKPLPGANSSGGSLVSFDPESSWSWGHKGSDTVAVGITAYFGYPTALRWLLTHQRIHLSETCTAVWWTTREHPLENLLGSVLDGRSDEPEKVVEAVEVLKQLTDMDVDVCVAVVAGSQGRGSVPWFRRIPGAQIVDGLLHHARHYGVPVSDGLRYPSLRWILLCCTRPGDRRRPLRTVRNTVAVDLLAASIGAGKPPRALARDALTELDRRLATSEDPSDALHPVRLRALASHVDGTNGITMTDTGLNIQRTDPPYVLGSLFAVMEEIQRRAIDSIRRNGRRNIADRWLREAKQRPAHVFPGLQSLCRNHLLKLQRKRHPGYYRLDDLYLNIQAKLQDAIPERFSWHDQSLFILGYDHMRAAIKKESRDAWKLKQEAKDAPKETADDPSAS